MNSRRLKWIVPIACVVLVALAVVFAPVAVGPIAIVAVLGISIYFSVVKQMARTRRNRSAEQIHDPDMAPDWQGDTRG